MTEEPEIDFADVLVAMFQSGDPDALVRAASAVDTLAAEAKRHYRAAELHSQQAAQLTRRSAAIERIVKTSQPHWTPRTDQRAENRPTPETLAKSRKRRHDPIRTLYSNGVLDDDQLKAASRISYVFEQLTRLSNFHPRDLAAAGMGGIGRSGGRKPATIPAEVAREHSKIYKPWADQCHASKSIDLPIVIDVVVFCQPLRTVKIKHERLVQMLKDALDIYAALRINFRPDED